MVLEGCGAAGQQAVGLGTIMLRLLVEELLALKKDGARGLPGCRPAGCRAWLARKLTALVEILLAPKKDSARGLWDCRPAGCRA